MIRDPIRDPTGNSTRNSISNDLLVELIDASRTFGDGKAAALAMRDITCSIRASDQIALTGVSGSGKTTLLHIIAGLDTPTSGTVRWPSIGSRQELRPGPVAVVFQAPSLIASLNVIENTELPLLLKGTPPREARPLAVDSLAKLGLDSLANKLPEELSGGQAQRVAVARILADSPRLILADEPTGQLDRVTGSEIIRALITASNITGAALVINTHDPEVANQLPIRWSMAAGTLITQTISVP